MFHIERIFAAFSCLTLLLVFPLILTTVPASALTKEAAIENCRNRVGRPIVMACMRGGGNSFEGCREKARPQVVACVVAALNAANGRANVAVAVPTEAVPKPVPGTALPAGFVAPPRTISDIRSILDGEKPDPALIERLKTAANAVPTGKEARGELSQFYFDRSAARSQLGRLADAITDANKAIEVGRGVIDAFTMGRNAQLLALNYFYAGDLKQSLDIYLRMLRETNVQGAKGYAFSTNRQISNVLAQMGDVPQAEAYLRRSLALIQEARTSGLPGWRDNYRKFGQNWEAEVEFNRAVVFEARGQFREAEASYRMMEQRKRAGMQAVLALENAPTRSTILQSIDAAVAGQARMKARLGRLAEAEVDARRALLSRLQDTGKYNSSTARYVMNLADILVEEGRYEEAEQLTRVVVDINRTVGLADDLQATVTPMAHLAGILRLEHKNEEATAIFNQIDAAVAKWDPQRRQAFELNPSRILSLYASGQVDAGIAAAEQLVKRQVQRVGENHFDAASAHGTFAIGLMRAGRDGDAIREFKAAIPVMLANAQENADDEDTTLVAARSLRLQTVVESYFTLLARAQGATDAVGEETFGLADSVRGHTVQQALAASSARAAAHDPALADLVRKEQDLAKQVNAQLGALNNVLAIPSSERDEKGVQQIQSAITTQRAERDKARLEIKQKFPAYAELVSPKPPNVQEIRATLADGEAMLSFYFGQDSAFVWAVPKSGPIAFAAVNAKIGDVESKIRKLREALEPQAAMISDIPPFDLKLGYELYELLLKPVESGWKPAKNLIVVTNGALGLLPLSLLPTAPSEVKEDDEPLFAGYRKVPWLARTHAVTSIPSAAALRTLRQLPPGKAGRGALVAFGDPYFNRDQQIRGGNRRADGRGQARRQDADHRRRQQRHARRTVEAAQQPETRGRRQRRDWSVAAAARYRRGVEVDRAGATGGPLEGALPRKGRERERGEDDEPLRLQDRGFRHPRPGAGRTQRLDATGVGVVCACCHRRRRRRAPDHGRNPRPETRCRLGDPVGLQHRRRCRSRRGGGLGTGPRLLLCGHARASGHELVGAFPIGAAARHRSVQAAGRRPENRAQ